jgi:tRNA A-37 threonylcarbamoyl transferase component Bud32/DNA/RNA endonuclease YhcR with UshA esterase domain
MKPFMSHVGDGDDPHPLREPPDIPGFTWVRLIGAGGMGAVYEAWQEQPHRRVAVKVPRAGRLGPELVTRMQLEAELLGRLEHPGIARIYAAGSVNTDDGARQPYLVMELVEGQPVTTYAEGQQLDLRDRLTLFRDIALAVHHAHQQGVVHRDLKPENILVDQQGNPKVVDFGVGWLEAAADRAGSNKAVGTAAYMALEQQAGSKVGVDVRVDVYALGLILYELLTGKFPFEIEGLGRDDIFAATRTQTPVPPGSFDRRCRGDLEAIVAKGMEREREQRYSSAAAVAEDVDHYLARRPVNARNYAPLYVIGLFIRRHRLLFGTGVAVILSILGGSVAAVVGLTRARAAEKQALSAERQAQANLIKALDTIDQFTTFVVEGQLSDIPGAEPVQNQLLNDAVFFYQDLLAENQGDEFIKNYLALALSFKAEFDREQGQFLDAQDALDSRINVLLDLREREPERYVEHTWSLARASMVLARNLDRDGQQAESARRYEECHGYLMEFLERRPNDLDARVETAYLLGNWARILPDVDKQRELYDEALVEWDALRRDFPGDGKIRRGWEWTRQRRDELRDQNLQAAPDDALRGPDRPWLAVEDTAAIRKAVGREVRVRGRIQEVALNRGRDRFTYVNFGRDTKAFFGIIHRNALPRFVNAFGEELLDLPGRDVEMTGVVAIHRDRPELVLNQPAQIRFLDDGSLVEQTPAIIDAADAATIRAHIGRVASLRGEVSAVRKGDTHGVTLVEFVGEGENALVAVIPRDTWRYMQESLGGAPAEVLPGKTVTVEGRIYLYKNQPNIEIKSPEHLRVESAH